MEHIDKKSEHEANDIIDAYLNLVCLPGISERTIYDDFTANDGKHKLIDNVLLPEQEYRCCYCMMKMGNCREASIEHVIPQSIRNKGDFLQYFNTRAKNYLNYENVCLTSDFIKGRFVFPPYPHVMSYYNFSIACTDCNNHRGSQYIEPLFFYPDIKNEIQYNEKTGEMNWSADPVLNNGSSVDLPTIEKVELNTPLLKAIRCVWFYAKSHKIDLGKLKQVDERYEILYQVAGEAIVADCHFNDETLKAYLNLQTDKYWNKLLKYDYFGI